MQLLRAPLSALEQVASNPHVQPSWCDRDLVVPASEDMRGESHAESLSVDILYGMCTLFLALVCAFNAHDSAASSSVSLHLCPCTRYSHLICSLPWSVTFAVPAWGGVFLAAHNSFVTQIPCWCICAWLGCAALGGCFYAWLVCKT